MGNEERGNNLDFAKNTLLGLLKEPEGTHISFLEQQRVKLGYDHHGYVNLLKSAVDKLEEDLYTALYNVHERFNIPDWEPDVIDWDRFRAPGVLSKKELEKVQNIVSIFQTKKRTELTPVEENHSTEDYRIERVKKIVSELVKESKYLRNGKPYFQDIDRVLCDELKLGTESVRKIRSKAGLTINKWPF